PFRPRPASNGAAPQAPLPRSKRARPPGPRSLSRLFSASSHAARSSRPTDLARADYLRAGMKSFKPHLDEPGRSTTYYAVPLDVLESPIELVEWARKAIDVAKT